MKTNVFRRVAALIAGLAIASLAGCYHHHPGVVVGGGPVIVVGGHHHHHHW